MTTLDMSRIAMKERRQIAEDMAERFTMQELRERRKNARLMEDREEHRIFDIACLIKAGA